MSVLVSYSALGKYQNLDSFNNRNLFVTILRLESQRPCISLAGFFLVCRPQSSCCIITQQRERGRSSLLCLSQGIVSFICAPPSQYNAFQKSLLQMPSHEKLELQYVNLEGSECIGHIHSVHGSY